MAEIKNETKTPPDAKPVKAKAAAPEVALEADMEASVTAVRDIAEKSVAQAKDAFEKMKSVAEETTDVVEDTYVTAAKGLADFNIRMLEALRANINASFDFTRAVLQVKTLSQAVELTSSHFRKQFDAMIDQSRELTEVARKVTNDAAQPVKTSVEKLMKPAA